mgnify:CR=1 FL=1
MKQTNQIPGLYDPSFEHDNCGIGACVNIKGVKNHQTVDNALKIVETLEHRAGKDAAGETGDGVGIMLQISHKFFSKACKAANINIGKEREYGIGMFFFPNDELRLRQAKKMFEIIVEKEGMTFLGWREVPTTPAVLGKKALECMPKILQGFVAKPADVEKGLDFDRKLYIARKVFEQSNEESYVVSLSSRTIVYKGMFLVGQLRTFFNDLQDSDYESAIALVHSRFSTNTTPSWEKAHPYRFIVHNGEISSYDANRRFIEMFGYQCTLQTDTEVITYIMDYLLRVQKLSLGEAASVIAAPFWSLIENKTDLYDKKKHEFLRTVFPSLLITGPFSIVFGFNGGLMALNDRLKLRSMVVGEKDDKVFVASEEAAIRVMEPNAENMYAPAGGEPVMIKVKKGAF